MPGIFSPSGTSSCKARIRFTRSVASRWPNGSVPAFSDNASMPRPVLKQGLGAVVEGDGPLESLHVTVGLTIPGHRFYFQRAGAIP